MHTPMHTRMRTVNLEAEMATATPPAVAALIPRSDMVDSGTITRIVILTTGIHSGKFVLSTISTNTHNTHIFSIFMT